MSNALKVPFCRQETDTGCLPACAQMVLSYLGITRSQTELVHILGTHPLAGTPYSRITRLRSLDIEVTYQTGDLDDVSHYLAQNIPVIAFVQLRELSYWGGRWAQHALVVVAVDETNVQVLDPAQGEQIISISREEFVLAWDEMNNTYTALTKL